MGGRKGGNPDPPNKPDPPNEPPALRGADIPAGKPPPPPSTHSHAHTPHVSIRFALPGTAFPVSPPAFLGLGADDFCDTAVPGCFISPKRATGSESAMPKTNEAPEMRRDRGQTGGRVLDCLQTVGYVAQAN